MMAKVINISVDSRREIDQELKKVCEEFTRDTIISIVEPLSTFMIKLSTKKSAVEDVTGDNAISSKQVHEVLKQFQEAAEERLCYTVKKLCEYINDRRMEEILLKPVQMSAVDYYRSFYEAVSSSPGHKVQSLEKPLMSVEEMENYLSNIITNASSTASSPNTTLPQ